MKHPRLRPTNTYTKITFADEFLYTMASGLVKISILSYFLRFFSPYVSNSLRYLTYATMVFVFLHMIIFTEELFLNCVPFSQTFMVVTADQNRQCVAGGVWGGVRNVSALVQDFIPAVLAVLMAWQMEVHRHQKIGVLVTLALAFGVCFVGIVRVGYFSSIYFTAFDWSCKSHLNAFLSLKRHFTNILNLPGLGGQAFTWSAVECLLGIICASLPALSVSSNSPPSQNSTTNPSYQVFIYGVPPPMPAASEKDPMWRKFSMNESGRNGANNKGVFVHQKEVGSTDSLATSRNPNGYGGRRRSRVASMAPVVGEKEW